MLAELKIKITDIVKYTENGKIQEGIIWAIRENIAHISTNHTIHKIPITDILEVKVYNP